MDIIKMTRELGKAIQEDERFKEYIKARDLNDSDKQLQELIGEFNLKRVQLNEELSKADKDSERLSELDSEIKSIYGNIIANEKMAAYNNAKAAMDSLLGQINMVITLSANGDDPDTCPSEQPKSG